MDRTVILSDGTQVPCIGQGTWVLGEHRDGLEREQEALRAGIESGMTLIDTAEMYGDGRAGSLCRRPWPVWSS